MSENYPKISVITICKNEDHIRDTCESIKALTYPNCQWIVVDGASTDKTLSILNEYTEYIYTLVSEPDTGRYQAMNKGAALADGDWLLFLNGGDYLVSPEVFDNIFSPQVTPSLTDWLAYDLSGDLLFGEYQAKETGKLIRPPVNFHDCRIDLDYFVNYTLPHEATFIRREAFEQVGKYDETLRSCGDLEWFMRALLKFSLCAKYLPIVVTVYNFDGLSSQRDQDTLKANLTERDRVLCLFKTAQSPSPKVGIGHVIINKKPSPLPENILESNIHTRQVEKGTVINTLRRKLTRTLEYWMLFRSGLFFDTFYWQYYLDIRQLKANPLKHYIYFGASEGRLPNPFFDTDWYLSSNGDVARDGINPLLHYHLTGWKENRDPHPDFSTSAYLLNNPDVQAMNCNPLWHYLHHGILEGRCIYPSKKF